MLNKQKPASFAESLRKQKYNNKIKKRSLKSFLLENNMGIDESTGEYILRYESEQTKTTSLPSILTTSTSTPGLKTKRFNQVNLIDIQDSRNFDHPPPASLSQAHISSLGSKREKFDNDTPNEFTSGYAMRPPEIIVIVLILILWVLSLRKFVKNFDKLRTTHYREIPYKYQLKDPHNLNQIRVVQHQTDSVIYSRDPVKHLGLKSLNYNSETNSNVETSTNNSFNPNDLIVGNETRYSLKSKREDRISLKTSRNSLNYQKKNKSSSLTSLSFLNSTYGQSEFYIEEKIKKSKPIAEDKRYAFQSNKMTSLTNKDSNLLDPSMLSPFIRQSLLDLHQKSVENVSKINQLKIQKYEKKYDQEIRETTFKVPSVLKSPNTYKNKLKENKSQKSEDEKLRNMTVSIKEPTEVDVKFVESPI